MEREPAFGWRWQAHAAAQRPTPHPEMTTVWPSSRTLPTWKTDGFRLLLTEPSPRRSHLRDRDLRRDVLGIGRPPRALDPFRRKVIRWREEQRCRPRTERNYKRAIRRRQLFPSVQGSVGGSSPSLGASWA